MSIFSALEECCPGCCRNNATASGRRGLTMIEYNKVLEKHGFEKMRDRRTDAATRAEDPTGGEHIGKRVRAASDYPKLPRTLWMGPLT
mmetsp:Transcript_19067/g.30374  ORF Transcript_19067/g.30374 Transcript_19067/m.30374 type:complete len:88 (-) Transcript_19067:213-476(-)